MAELHVLRVFVDAAGGAGNPLGVFLDGAAVPRDRRQAVAADLGFAETVFVDDRAGGRLEIYTPRLALPFAGHPLVGLAWLLGQTGEQPRVLRPPAGEVGVFAGDGLTWIRARPEWAPQEDFRQLDSAAAVDALNGPPIADGELYVWAWEDEQAGSVQARFFAPGFGIAEDPATGSAAVKLCARLGRELRIMQRGSELVVRPSAEDGWVDLGGRAVLDLVREYEVG